MATRAYQRSLFESLTPRARCVVEDQRAQHPELRRRLTWNGARAILRRLRIEVVYAPGVSEAALVCMGGVTVVLLNSDVPPRRHTYRLAHELAHYWLHADREAEPVYRMDAMWPDDTREDEAELVATVMLGGPRYF